ncbi:MAG: hypothetical protein K2K97_11685 [Muribaculaceae bacterium]|nr:hypothetical protein [Muribaculaceae bacterium]
MIQSTKLSSGLTKLTATAGLIHKTGTDTYVKSVIMLPDETLDMYEEVAEKPAYTEEQYKRKVAELIHERYSTDDEIGLGNNMREENPTEEHVAEYRAYQAYRAECKQRAKDPSLYVDKETV